MNLIERKPPIKRSWAYWYSNEGNLHRLFPFVENKTGTILAVGSDQGLDLLANTNCSGVEMVDRAGHVGIVMKAVLEVAKSHFTFPVSNTTRNTFFNDFEFNSLKNTRHKLNDMEARDVDVAMEIFEGGVPLNSSSGEKASYAEYMRLRSGLRDKNGKEYAWYGSCEAADKVLKVYNLGGITISAGDLCDPQTIEDIGERLGAGQNSQIGVIYVSNAEEHIDQRGKVPLQRFWAGMRLLPFSPEATILRTAQAYDYQRIGRLGENEENPLYNVLRSWHYNAEEMAHRIVLAERKPFYEDNEGWLRIVRGYRRLGIGKFGVSHLDLDTTLSHAAALGVPASRF